MIFVIVALFVGDPGAAAAGEHGAKAAGEHGAKAAGRLYQFGKKSVRTPSE